MKKMSSAKNDVISELLKPVLRNLWQNIFYHYCVKYIYIYIYIYSEREREREREREA